MGSLGSKPGSDQHGENAGSKSHFAGNEPGGATGFGRRRERPDADLMRVLNTGSSGQTLRVPRSISPPLD